MLRACSAGGGKFAVGYPVLREARCLDWGCREKEECHVWTNIELIVGSDVLFLGGAMFLLLDLASR